MLKISQHVAIRNALMGAFLGAAGLSVSGCATTKLDPCMKPDGLNIGVIRFQKTTYDKTCSGEVSTRLIYQTGDDFARAGAMAAMRENHPNIDKGMNIVAEAIANRGEKTYTAKRNPDGSVVLVGTPVIVAPAIPESQQAKLGETQAKPQKQPEPTP